MAGFSSSQISDMISRRKYEVKRGDTLSELAESFMKEFTTLNRFSRSNIEDMIFNENSSNAFKDRNKSLLLEGKYLELKFILEARRREFKFDHSAKEYVFTDEDRLAYALEDGRSSFWDHFCRCDRDCGEFLRESLKEQGFSSLPKSVSLNHKLSQSNTHRDLIENVKREVGSSKKVVKLDLIAEKILVNIGYNSLSFSQIADLTKKLIDENHLNTCRDEKCVCIPYNQIEKLSTKAIDVFYKNAPISSRQKDDLKKSEYVVTKADAVLGDEKKFWESLEKGIGSSLEYVKDTYKKLGLSLKLKENEKLFIPPTDIDAASGKWANEWKAVEKFWDEHEPKSGDKKTFKKYWVWSHEFVKFKGISTSATKTEICDIKYTMHYMAQGAFSDDYAKKIVAMTKAIVKGKEYLLCEKDDSMKELIEPSTLYLFKSIDKSAQKQFIEMMLQVKSEMGTSFQKFHITSAFRSPFIHAHTVIKPKVPTEHNFSEYKEPDESYYLALQDAYYGREIRQRHIKNENDIRLIQTIPKGDIGKIVEVSIQLMEQENTDFQGTDHKYGNALDIAPTTTGEKLYKKILELRFYAYQPKNKKFYHVSFIKK